MYESPTDFVQTKKSKSMPAGKSIWRKSRLGRKPFVLHAGIFIHRRRSIVPGFAALLLTDQKRRIEGYSATDLRKPDALR